ncbi:MAG: rhodanese-like domain-containing protein [Ignavibacteria bacterium]|nr:MAG: rhodanese-like domain-containing protein [Ignavibacteria bacterium]
MGIFGALFGGDDFENLSAEEFKSRLNETKDAVLIDVRTKPEHNEVRIPNSKLIEIQSNDFVEKIKNLDRSKSYFLYCRSGSRSHYAAKAFTKLGFEKVYNLKGGIISWNGPTERN